MATFSEPFLPRHSWFAALLFGTAATPAAVILAILAPRPLDALLAWPLVVLDIWVASRPELGTVREPTYQGTLVRLLAFLVGVVLTWLTYVLLARLALWRFFGRGENAP